MLAGCPIGRKAPSSLQILRQQRARDGTTPSRNAMLFRLKLSSKYSSIATSGLDVSDAEANQSGQWSKRAPEGAEEGAGVGPAGVKPVEDEELARLSAGVLDGEQSLYQESESEA